MKAEIARLRSSDESDLIAQIDTPNHISFTSRKGRPLTGEISIFWDRFGEPRSVAAIVAVCETNPRRARPIAQASFIRSPDGTLTAPTYDPCEQVSTGVPLATFHDGTVEALHLDRAARTLQVEFELDRHWNPGATETLSLRFEDVTDYELTELSEDRFFNIVMSLTVVVADDGRLDVQLDSCYPGSGVEGRFRCGSIVET